MSQTRQPTSIHNVQQKNFYAQTPLQVLQTFGFRPGGPLRAAGFCNHASGHGDARAVGPGRVQVWDGSASGNFSNGGNWVGGVAPVAGDDLVFQLGVTQLLVTNNSVLIARSLRCYFREAITLCAAAPSWSPTV